MNQQNPWRNVGVLIAFLVALLSPLSSAYRALAYSVSAQGTGNTTTLETVTAAAGSSGTFSILLDNSDAVASGQLRFTYDATLGIAITGVQVTDRTTGFASTGSAYATGDANLLGYQVLFYNLNNLTISPGSGAILTVAYTIAANSSGSTVLHFTQAILASALAQSLPVTLVDGSLTIQGETATATVTPTNTDVPPTATATATPTNTDVPPTATPTATPTDTDVPPTATATTTPINTDVPPTATPTVTPTNTDVSPTATATATPTNTNAPSTATATATPINTDVPPTATATATNTDAPPTATATATPTNTDVPPTATATFTPTNTDVPPTATDTPTATPGAEQLYISVSATDKVNGIQINDEDIARFDALSRTWTILFDGSNVGVAKTDVDAFYLWYEGNAILMSFDKPVRIPALGWVDDSDIVKFVPSSLGEGTTAGTFELFFDGSMVDLTSSGEDIDAIGFSPEGLLLISTSGTVGVSGVDAKDEDLLAFAATGLGANTNGTWSLYFDGSAVNLGNGSEDVDGAFAASSGALYLTTKGGFSAVDVNGNNLAGKASDIFRCSPVVMGPISSCALDLPFAEHPIGIDKDINGLALAPDPGLSLVMGTSSLAVSDEIEQYEVEIDEPDADDEELDAYDLNVEETTNQLFLPFVTR
ncbi:MAG: hypothetical protein R2867_37620 [Caldilineaceae bacterium]